LITAVPNDAEQHGRPVDPNDTVTITVTIPASLVNAHEINLTLTPRSQRIAVHTPSEHAIGPPTPVNTPRRQPPRFELPGRDIPRTHLNNGVETVDDPFTDNNVRPASRAPNNIRVVNVDSDDDGEVDHHPNRVNHRAPEANNLPDPIYPRAQGQNVILPAFALRPFRYYVVTKGKKVGVFYGTWYVSVVLLNY
jgi:hypothetical protein